MRCGRASDSPDLGRFVLRLRPTDLCLRDVTMPSFSSLADTRDYVEGFPSVSFGVGLTSLRTSRIMTPSHEN
jgi:hypothetical protein